MIVNCRVTPISKKSRKRNKDFIIRLPYERIPLENLHGDIPPSKPSIKPIPKPPSEPINYEEDKVQARLSAELQGEREVLTPAGYIDVLTETEVIEVKSAHNWKHAIGQVIVYGSYFPTRQKRIHLFGDVDNLSLIEQHCTPLNIKVTTND